MGESATIAAPPGVTLGDAPPAAPPGVSLGDAPPPSTTTSTPQSLSDDAWRQQIIQNKGGEGYYQMKGPGGAVPVPHSSVPEALGRGYDFADDKSKSTFATNWKANPSTKYLEVPTREKVAAMQAQPAPSEGRPWYAGTQGDEDVVREIGAHGINLLDMLTSKNPLKAVAEGSDVGDTMVGNPNAGWTSKTLAAIMEYLAGEKGIQSVPGVAMRLKQMVPALEVLEKYPRLQRAVLAGMEGAPGMAAQSLATGQGAEAANRAAVAGAVTPFATETAGAALSATGRGAGKVLDKFKPKTVNIGSEAGIPVEPRQLGEGGEILPTGTEARKTAVEQQQAFERDMQHGARRAVRTSLQGLNESIGPEARPLLAAPPPGSDLPTYTLTGPTGGEVGGQQGPMLFDLAGPPTTERAEGALTQEARPLPAGAPSASTSYRGDWQLTTDENGVKRWSPPGGYMHPGDVPPGEPDVFGVSKPGEPAPPAREDVVGGGGVMRGDSATDNPARAVAFRNEYRRIMDSPEFRQLPPEQQAQIKAAHDHLTDQLGMYYAHPHGGIIPADIGSATANTFSPGDAAEQLRNAVKPGFDELNKVTGGRINQLSEEIQSANSTLRNPKASPAERAAAWETINNSNDAITSEMARHAGDTPITRSYYNAMRKTYMHAAVLDGVDNIIEGWSNGISRENTAKNPNLMRVIRANTKDFENFLSRGNNRQVLSQLMGPDAEETIKSWGQLLADPATARKTGNVLDQVINWGVKHKLMTGAYLLSPLFGTSYHTALGVGTAGYAATIGARALMRRAAMSPNVTRLLRYAVENNVDSRIYAPLIARAISAMDGGQQQPQEQPSGGGNE